MSIWETPAEHTKGAEVDVDVGGFEVRAVGAPDASEVVDARDEGAHETQVDEGDE